jgi:hypothetical protein
MFFHFILIDTLNIPVLVKVVQQWLRDYRQNGHHRSSCCDVRQQQQQPRQQLQPPPLHEESSRAVVVVAAECANDDDPLQDYGSNFLPVQFRRKDT